ncbi:MAG: hypothetical protein A2469_04550 [Candidatus Magasanikbacteria bacterium RIFOXYC2_FULL_40_16]|uniref:Probable transcriptional regulatory protein A2373_04545 n=2 Tax=Candidatus Magasanikiibacteriota TaxID=1752731 RepID=A0A1F6NH36_9BACT|nr:MAG: hypothetical protein A2224_02450 [Candidatus Magasanikbacteria bacterium RIFOXYA2_FULL_40_20]OGH83181.1 MAG: hypothetical protein A2373_04545 [Candidatus Magasanikbacteria bacterium RIFOXYB1_FULL_40_15]OGH86656.1 MAG: hypothetical protein A2301_00600 [Candidatus Magasanikbacteria bacterium RIFOXYB2_FULL_40_13]OGH89439.1 MAG: hypothetical protein A2469_04550 [Candidatus Magasanikbacteria bacterium RIFOXYC2_FULL_40_16]
MSGHSKWANIQQKKGKMDSARSGLFTKLSKGITIAARGGGDPEMNFSLRLAIEKAKGANMPKDNIERAVKRGTGESGEGAVLEEILYEGFGPGGTAFLIETVTDNKNRTASEIKHAFLQFGGSMGGPGSVKWQFKRMGVIRLNKEQLAINNEQSANFELELIEAGADDIVDNEYGMEIHCPIEKLQAVLGAVNKRELTPESSGLEWVAKENISLKEGESATVNKLYEILDELDDVEAVYTNEA